MAMLGAVTGCSGPLSSLSPAGPQAEMLARLWWLMFWAGMALFALVMVLLAISYIRPSLMRRLSAGQWIIAGGLLLPVPVLVALTGASLVLGEQMLPHRTDGSAPLLIEVQAARWYWTFTYPDSVGGGTTENVLHIPAGEPVDFLVTSRDVIHSFWIPRLGGKMDAIPGHENTIRLQTDEPGHYYGICAEYCGEGHDGMRFRVEAHASDQFPAAIGETAP